MLHRSLGHANNRQPIPHPLRHVGRSWSRRLAAAQTICVVEAGGRSVSLGDLTGQIFGMFILTVAAAESAIGLAIVVVYFRNRGSIAVDDINLMRG